MEDPDIPTPCLTRPQILASRTEKRTVGGKAGNSFSVATFAAREDPPPGVGVGPGGEQQYWESLLPEAVQVGGAV